MTLGDLRARFRLIESGDFRLISRGSQNHASAQGFWYDQDRHLWDVVLKVAARLRFEDEAVEMEHGDFMNIPAHKKHRLNKEHRQQY